MTPEQASLFNQMKKLSKQANQRIVRLERFADIKEPFAVKQLGDYLSAETLNVWTKKGRVSSKKGLTVLQMKSINKAIERFIEDVSTVKKAKSYVKKLSEEIGVEIPVKHASAEYQLAKEYKWIYNYTTESEFWDFARECVKYMYDFDEFFDMLNANFIHSNKIDEELNIKIQYLYQYIQGVKV